MDLHGRDREYLITLQTVGERLGIQPILPDDAFLHESDLNAVAAHLGEQSALVLYSDNEPSNEKKVDSSLISANRRLFPWMQDFAVASNLMTYGTGVDEFFRFRIAEEGYFTLIDHTIDGTACSR